MEKPVRIARRRPYSLPERAATPRAVALGDRRRLLGAIGWTATGALAGVLGGCAGPRRSRVAPPERDEGPDGLYPAPRNASYRLDRALTDEAIAASYNNFYEFTEDKRRVAELARSLVTSPWTVEVAGLVHRPRRFDVDWLIGNAPLEERLYRHRCVEAWAMAVPWTGFPLRWLLDRVEPLGSARYVRFVSFLRPDQAPNQRNRYYPWPYYEGLRIDEARHELTLLACGIYGHPLPPQHGAPLRLVVPWKYGFKSAKSIVRIELVAERPPTFWNDLAPNEYDFLANVDPSTPHPRWSQAQETMIGTGEVRPTLPYNGYGEWVASLYA